MIQIKYENETSKQIVILEGGSHVYKKRKSTGLPPKVPSNNDSYCTEYDCHVVCSVNPGLGTIIEWFMMSEE